MAIATVRQPCFRSAEASAPDEADFLDLLVVEGFDPFAEIDAAVTAIEAVGILVFFKAPDDHSLAAERFQQAASLAEQHPAKADALIFRAQVELVDFAFLWKGACTVEPERRSSDTAPSTTFSDQMK